jgi:hypothetical protein
LDPETHQIIEEDIIFPESQMQDRRRRRRRRRNSSRDLPTFP